MPTQARGDTAHTGHETRDKKMSAVSFDTLKFAQTLRDKGKLTVEQAEGISEAFADATSEQMITKTDLHTELAPMRSEMNLQRWMLGVVMALQIAIFVKLFVH